MPPRLKVAIVGAGIYGTTAAIKLAERGHSVTLFDPLGVLQAASAINQYRIHAGYHYPRSAETIAEVQETRQEFINEFAPAVVSNSKHYYAIPEEGSLTSVDDFEHIMREFCLPHSAIEPEWMDMGHIARCWAVDEELYDPGILRSLLNEKIKSSGVVLRQERFDERAASQWDEVVWATYGLHDSRKLLKSTRKQVAEKVLISLPEHLRHIALVIIDGPFTAFDPYGSSEYSLFGSAKYTNHWSTDDPFEDIPEPFSDTLNRPSFQPFDNTRFKQMVEDGSKAVPAVAEARYLGSRFTVRVVEHNPDRDQRLLYVERVCDNSLQIFSGKVVGAVKAAKIVVEMAENGSLV